MQYLVIIEKSVHSYGTHVPDLPGCVVVGESKAEVHRMIIEAIQFHFEGLQDDFGVVPPPLSTVEFIDVVIDYPISSRLQTTDPTQS